VRNLKRDIETIDPVDEASFGVAGAVAALFARNPALITKQALATDAACVSKFYVTVFPSAVPRFLRQHLDALPHARQICHNRDHVRAIQPQTRT
jgi:hypothetical protein